MTARSRRRRRRPGPSPWTWAVLATGLVLATAGGYLQFRGGEERQQTPQAQQAAPAGLAVSPIPSTKPTPTPTKPRGTTSGDPDKPATPRQQAAGSPQRITVPRLGVAARVLGIRAKGGSLVPPANPSLVGWWSEGARPGAAKGSAIITGHTVHNGGGAFDDLDRLVVDDLVTVSTGRKSLRYKVVSVKIYGKGALAKQAGKLFDQGGPGRLVLVTCEDWNGTEYESNAVVIARPLT